MKKKKKKFKYNIDGVPKKFTRETSLRARPSCSGRHTFTPECRSDQPQSDLLLLSLGLIEEEAVLFQFSDPPPLHCKYTKLLSTTGHSI